MRVDATSHPTRSFYDGHGHPFSQSVEGWHGRSGSERRGSGLFAQPGPITPTLRRDVPSFNVRLEGLGRRRFVNVTGLRVRPNPPALPKLFGTSNQAVGVFKG